MFRPGPMENGFHVVPYIGTWIETYNDRFDPLKARVVPYIGTWIETFCMVCKLWYISVVPYIGTWIETFLRELYIYCF